MENKPHIKLERFSEQNSFKYTKPGFSNKQVKQTRDRNLHGQSLLNQVNAVREFFDLPEDQEIEGTLVRDDVVYVQFTSDWGYELAFDLFDKDGLRQNKKLFQLLSVRPEIDEVDGEVKHRYHVLVVVNRLGIKEFIDKIQQFLTENIERNDKATGERIVTDNPKNSDLLNNIQIIQLATLRAFWSDEPEIPFPTEDDMVWWEVWFRRTGTDNDNLDHAVYNLLLNECQVGDETLELTEHYVKLVKGTADQLSKSLLVLNNLAELRNPQQISDFITHKDISDETKKQYLVDLVGRTDSELSENSVLICLLDSGVTNKHPLLTSFLPDDHLYTYRGAWGKEDSEPHGGHGTGVAGLALYGDLTDALSHSNRIQIYHGLESYKIYHPKSANDPELYGAITESAVATPVIDRPKNLRVYCMTVTDKSLRFNGRPSAWSSAIDKITFGRSDVPTLFILSGGNVSINKHEDYPSLNMTEYIHDPAQAYNAVTVGTYTRKDKISVATGHSALAPNGGMAPSNSTSLLFDKDWPNKPDVVFEGGNSSTDGIYVSDHSELKLLSLDSDYQTDIFIPFGDTSGAAALASKMAAEIRTMYPDYWPETVRALLVHSADWTTSMLSKKTLVELKEQDKKNLLRTVGYGVPNIERALYSVENNLNLIAERYIQPYKWEDSRGKYKDYHLYELPWPKEALESLEAKNVTLKVTLSYYIEPNPGSRRFATHYQYHSHQLDFEIIKRNESLADFKIRISKPDDEDVENPVQRKGATWLLGRPSVKGSVRKDMLNLSGREMADRNVIAVYPKNGWYKNLKRQNKFNEEIRYSLIVSLETESEDVDLYSPVLVAVEANKIESAR